MTSLAHRFTEKYGRVPTEFDPDYLEMLRMSKYRILDVPDQAPGKCANCGASKNDGRKYVDFGLQVDWYGVVHLCGHCLGDVSQAMGLFDELRSKLEESQSNAKKIEGLKEKGVELHETVVKTFKELEEFYVSVRPLGNNSNSDSASGMEPDKAAVESGTNQTKSRVAKSAPSTGSKNIHSLTELLNPN